MTDKKYHSPFMRVNVSKEGGEKIKTLQQDFDRFWKKINHVSDKCPEKFNAMKAMQEACMWLTRACALQNEGAKKIEPEKPDGMLVLNKNRKDKPEIFKNTPQIIVKKKKI